MSKIAPPFRADHVGSLLRTPPIFDARQQWRAGEIDAGQLRAIEDREIASTIEQLAATGIRAITDGEFRREWFHLDFLQHLGGITIEGMIAATSDAEETVHQAPPRITVTGKLTHDHPIQVDDYRFVAAHTPDGCQAKVAIPSPTMAHFRGGRAGIDIQSYPDLDLFFDDLAQAYRDEIGALYAAGCRYVQLDDTNLAYLCDPGMRQGAIDRGDDPNELQVDAYFLEYDDERSGGFAPLRFVPSDKTVVLGLITSKFPELEPADEVRQRIDEAAHYVDLDQLCLSPQCGFSSTIHGNVMTHDEQWAKLRHCVEIADSVWG